MPPIWSPGIPRDQIGGKVSVWGPKFYAALADILKHRPKFLVVNEHHLRGQKLTKAEQFMSKKGFSSKSAPALPSQKFVTGTHAGVILFQDKHLDPGARRYDQCAGRELDLPHTIEV